MKNLCEIPILRDRAAYTGNQRSGWKPGSLCLTVDSTNLQRDSETGIRLRFWQGRNLVWQVSSEKVRAVSVETRALALGKKRVLSIAFADSAGRNRQAWFAVSNAQAWRQRLDEMFSDHSNDDLSTDNVARGFTGERRPFIDVLDEGDYFEIIVELLGAGAAYVVTRVNDRRLEVFPDDPPFYQRVVLPAKTEPVAGRIECNNGFLHVKLTKVKECPRL